GRATGVERPVGDSRERTEPRFGSVGPGLGRAKQLDERFGALRVAGDHEPGDAIPSDRASRKRLEGREPTRPSLGELAAPEVRFGFNREELAERTRLGAILDRSLGANERGCEVTRLDGVAPRAGVPRDRANWIRAEA